MSALSSFLSIVLPLVEKKGGIGKEKAGEAVEIVVEMVVERKCGGLSVSSVRGLVKCLGVLLEFCDLEEWESVKLGFETLLKFSVDKRPKVWHCYIVDILLFRKFYKIVMSHFVCFDLLDAQMVI